MKSVKKERTTLKSLDEHNKERVDKLEAGLYKQTPQPNGIACPICGNELRDSNPSVMLSSHPPKKNIDCPKCGYTGYRLA